MDNTDPETQPDLTKLFQQSWDNANGEGNAIDRQARRQASAVHQNSLTDYLNAVPEGVAQGMYGLTFSGARLASDAVSGMGGPKFISDDLGKDLEDATRPKTMLGGLTKGLTQFALAAGPYGKLIESIPGVAGMSGLSGFLVKQTLPAALADFTAFSGDDGHLSDLLVQYPWLNNPVTRYLSSKPDDGWATKRLKNALEGQGLLWALHGLGSFKAALMPKPSEAEEVARQIGLTPERYAEIQNSDVFKPFDDQIKNLAPSTTAQQRTVWFQLWDTMGKSSGQTGEEFISKHLADIRDLKLFSGDTSADVSPQTNVPQPLPEIPDEVRNGTRKDISAWASGNGYDLSHMTSLNESGVGKNAMLNEIDRLQQSSEDAFQKAKNAPLTPEEYQAARPGMRANAEGAKVEDAVGRQAAESVPDKLNARDASVEDTDPNTPNVAPEQPQNVVAEPPQTVNIGGQDVDRSSIKGLTQFLNDTQSIIYLNRQADFSTLLHEGFHIWRRMGLAPEDIASLESAFGKFGTDQAGRVAEEAAARAFERYFFNGQAPTQDLQPTFDKAKQWMTNIYKTLKGSPIGDTLHPDVEATFNRVLSRTGPAESTVESAKSGSLAQVLTQGDHLPQSYSLSMDRASGKVPFPDDVKQSVYDQVTARLKDGMKLDEALADAVRTHINFDRLDVHTDTESVIKSFQSMLDPIVDKGVGGVQSLETTKQMALDELRMHGTSGDAALAFADSLRKDAENLKDMASRLVAAKTVRNTVAEDIADKVRLYRSAATPTEAEGMLQDLMKSIGLYNKLNYATQVIQTEGARIPSAGRIVTGTANLDVEAMTNAIENTLSKGDFTSKKLAAVLEAAASTGNEGGIRNLLSDFEDFGRGIAKKALSIHNEVWINQLLGGTVGWSTKIVADLTNTLLQPGERLIGGALQTLFGKSYGNDAMQSAFRLYSNVIGQGADFFQLNRSALFAGQDSLFDNMSKSFFKEQPTVDKSMFDGRALTSANVGLDPASTMGKAVDWAGYAIRTPSRLYSTVDEFAKGLNYRAALADQAYQKAFASGLDKDTDAFKTFVQDYVNNGFDALGKGTNEEAMAYAKSATFSSELGTLGKWLQSGTQKMPMLKLFMPFVNVPSNIMRRFVQYTPGLNAIVDSEFRNALMGGSGPMAQAQALGRLTVGGMFWTTAIGMAAAGHITGAGPSNPQVKAQLMETGWRPWSVVSTDDDGNKTYTSYHKLEPFSMIYGLAADYHEWSQHMSDDDSNATATALIASVAKNLTSKSYYTGVSELLNVMDDPDKFGYAYLKQRASSYVAPIFQQVAGDPNLREARTVMDAVLRKLPGYSEDMAPKRNAIGEIVHADDPRWSPYPTTVRNGDTVNEGLAALNLPIPKVSRKLGGLDLTGYQNDQGQDAYDRYQQLVGETKVNGRDVRDSLDKLFNSDWYKQQFAQDTANNRQPTVTDESVAAVHKVLRDYHSAATQQLLREFPEIKQQSKALTEAHRKASNVNVRSILSYAH